VGWRPEFLEPFREGLRQVMLKLALDIVRDGEGATKLVVFNLKGAKSVAEAKRVSKMLANSLLVKTALFGEDPNWGRIAATVGASGVEASPELLTIKIGDVTLYRRGEILMTPEVEERAHQVMKGDSFKIEVDLGIGEGEWTCYGCDLSYEYVKINAEYRT
jgi:glutamate N-acetyltransferase/amino-acid N-acetyltransferase